MDKEEITLERSSTCYADEYCLNFTGYEYEAWNNRCCTITLNEMPTIIKLMQDILKEQNK